MGNQIYVSIGHPGKFFRRYGKGQGCNDQSLWVEVKPLLWGFYIPTGNRFWDWDTMFLPKEKPHE